MSGELYSMTGYGLAVQGVGAGELRIEVRSVNHRGREVRVSSVPRNLAWEHLLQQRAQAALARGKVDMRLEWTVTAAGGGDEAMADWLRLRARRWRQRSVLGAAPPWPADAPPVPVVGDDVVARVADAALAALMASRAGEGRALGAVLTRHLDELAATVAAYRAGLDDERAARTADLTARIAALAEQGLALDDRRRVTEEVAVQLMRGDVHEELDRLDAHVAAMRELLAAPEVAVGRRLDVLVQEQGREAHTLASKSATVAARTAALGMRAIIDRLREQIQNIE